MKTTLVVVPSYRAPQSATRRCLTALVERGAQLHVHEGVSDIALARSQVLTRALSTDAEMLLLLDDDMVIGATEAQRLVDIARESNHASSAVYCTKEGTLAATPYAHDDAYRADNLWLVGLGCCVIPMRSLRALAGTLSCVVAAQGEQIYPFCTSGPRADFWESEDYSLCRRLGGVNLTEVRAGHIKPVDLWPHKDDVRTILNGQTLKAVK